MAGPLGNIYTLQEAADQLRMTTRAVAKIAKREGLCTVDGRDLLFNDSDIVAIWNALRCPSNSSSAKDRTSGTSGVQSADRAFSNLLARATQKQQSRSASKQKRAS